MEKKKSKNLLVWGSTLIVIQNIIFIPSFILAFGINPDMWGFTFNPALWLDLIGFALIGVGLYFIGDLLGTLRLRLKNDLISLTNPLFGDFREGTKLERLFWFI